MSIIPSPSLKFGECIVGESQSCTVQLRNDSSELPICFTLKKIAHYHITPSYGYIEPNSMVDLTTVFRPNQIGSFKGNLELQIVGQKCDVNTCEPVFKKTVVQTLNLLLDGSSPSVVGKPHTVKLQGSKSNIISRHTAGKGIDVSETKESLKVLISSKTTTMGVPSVSIPAIKDCKVVPEEMKSTVAHPNDLATSIRPSNRRENVR